MALADVLDELSAPGELQQPIDKDSVRCTACAHHCLIKEGARGICKIRFNQNGQLQVPWGYVSSLQVDPIEKKPFYHFFAGEDALTFGMLGCNFHCGYCQNWLTSQALREAQSERLAGYVRRFRAEDIVSAGLQQGAKVVASSYNEPLITSEWAREIFSLAVPRGMHPVYVSNGYATPEVLAYLEPYLEGFKVDLKSMQKKHYRDLGGRLQPVLDSIRRAHSLGMWVEIVTLVVPGFNDTSDELTEMAEFIKSVSPDIPWHVTAFRPDYQMTDRPRTSPQELEKAVRIGYDTGLHYVYAGNLPGSLRDYENTRCHHCQSVLIERVGFQVRDYRISSQGTCPDCGGKIPGRWISEPDRNPGKSSGYPRLI